MRNTTEVNKENDFVEDELIEYVTSMENPKQTADGYTQDIAIEMAQKEGVTVTAENLMKFYQKALRQERNAQKSRDLRERRKKEGLKSFRVWLTEEEIKTVRPLIEKIAREREGFVEGKIDKNGRHSVFIKNKKLNIQDSLKIRDHSPTGFNWGYNGSGPAQTALAIMLELCKSKEQAERLYQDFKEDFVSNMKKGEEWEEPLKSVTNWICAKERTRRDDTRRLSHFT